MHINMHVLEREMAKKASKSKRQGCIGTFGAHVHEGAHMRARVYEEVIADTQKGVFAIISSLRERQ